MFGLQNVQPTSRNSAGHLSTKQDDFTSIFSKGLILKEILCRSVAKTEKWTTLVHFSDDFVSFDNSQHLSSGGYRIVAQQVANSFVATAGRNQIRYLESESQRSASNDTAGKSLT